MKVTILGCYSATPRTFTNPTSQVLEINNHIFLIDCGEGTQVELRRNKIKFSRINHIFISHLHGDHFYGLVGLVSTFRMLNRENPLHIYGPKGIKEAITLQLKLSNSWTDYPLHFHELTNTDSELVFEDEKVTVRTIPLQHRIYCNGFLFQEKSGDRKLLMSKVLNYDIDKAYYKSIKKGKDAILPNGDVIPNAELTDDPAPVKSYAFCSDTRYDEDKISLLNKVTALYHESTFLESHKHLCQRTGHSTAIEAATIASKADVENLILGHYSTRYDNIEKFKEEASTVFDNVVIGDDGKVFEF
ncbi:ribonuclease Z [Aquimarina sp. AD1]|uniref:ribonuclease Z n=1 Tax=unclassified Aquimarina TaxID=2627091 RepID=UPI000E4B95D7|nr:ribonuclease Z [Aquimarina sp. AD1]AXT55452.1 ribonuclease Z [Aquimarina sp. AD1]RKN16274.1 ribonuclease Z [Aquimarina sp. AD1]